VQITDIPAFFEANWHALRMAKASAVNMKFYDGNLNPAIILRLQSTTANVVESVPLEPSVLVQFLSPRSFCALKSSIVDLKVYVRLFGIPMCWTSWA